MKQTFHLPWPISVNSLWRAYKGRNILSMKARVWAKDAEKVLAVQNPRAIAGPVMLTICLAPPTKRAFDIDNRPKCLIDLLVRCGVIEADDCRTVKKLTVELGTGFVGAKVTVEPMEA